MTIWSATIHTNGTLHLKGEIDYSVAPQVRTYLHKYAGNSAGSVTLDLGQVEYIDSTGLAILLELRRILQTQQRSIRIAKASKRVTQLFNLTQVSTLFAMQTNPEEPDDAS